jgi:NAD(P)-dependent dehydrogenase (short-subunit alcohol dehydrogenase family)
MEKRIILLIGYKGLIGSYLCNFFLKKKNVYLKLVDKKKNLDLTDRISLEKFLKKNKNINYIVNASGKNDHVVKSRLVNNYEDEEILQSYIAENVIGPKNLIELSSKLCKNLRSIIHFSSLYGNKSPYHPMYTKKKSLSYCISKYAMEGLTGYYATLLASKKVRINNIRVGGIKSKQPASFVKNFIKKIPSNEMVPKKSLAHVVDFLCSKNSEYVIGENISLDGGYGLW